MAALFLAAGQDGLRITSRDGVKWNDAQTGKEGETYRAVAFGNGRFVAAGSYGGNNIFATTTDGTMWDFGKQDAKYSKYVRGLGFDGKQFIGIGGDPGSVGLSRPFFLTTTDGKNWSDLKEIPGKNMLRRLAFGKGIIVGVGDRGRRAASADGGATWQDAADVKPIDTLADIALRRGESSRRW